MSIPTGDDLLHIHSKAMANASDAVYVPDRIKAGCEAVRDATIKAIREALTSDEAVAILTRTLVELGSERAGIDDDTWPDDYNDVHVVVMMDESLKAITAALDAALGEGSGG